MEWRRLNLPRIEANLARLLEEGIADETWKRLREEPLTDDATRRLLEGYREIDMLLAERIDLFGYGESERILELNHLVLCGRTPERRLQYASHIEATQSRFYDDPHAGVAALMDRYGRSRRHPAPVLAAELYVQMVSAPQLFLEGNSRTAGLIATYCLARAGLPPLVVTSAALREYHNIVERAVVLERDGLTGMLGFGFVVRKLVHFIREWHDGDFLAPPEPAENSTEATGAEGTS